MSLERKIKPTHRVYIDEAGDTGFTFSDAPGKGSTKWLVLSAVIAPMEQDRDLVRIRDDGRRVIAAGMNDKNAKQFLKKPLHFQTLKHEQRKAWAYHVGSAGLRTSSILIRKPSFDKRDLDWFRQDPDALYFYASRVLLADICSHAPFSYEHRAGLCIEVIFDGRSRMEYEKLRENLDKLGSRPGEIWPDPMVPCSLMMNAFMAPKNPCWDLICPELISSAQSSSHAGLQIADCVASSMLKAVEENAYSQVECSYAQGIFAKDSEFTVSFDPTPKGCWTIEGLMEHQNLSGLAEVINKARV